MNKIVAFALLIHAAGILPAMAQSGDSNDDTCAINCSWYRPLTPDQINWIDSTEIMIDIWPYLDCEAGDCTLTVTPACDYLYCCLTIYNRWGEILHDYDVSEEGWYAFGNSSGAYIWQIQGVYKTGQTFLHRGHVYLLY